MPEYKASIPGVVKSIDGRTVIGIPSVLGNIDEAADRIWPGSYVKTIMERRAKFRHLWQHDFMQPPIATIDEIREVGRDELPESVLQQAPEAMGGLLVKRTYLDTPRGNEVLAGLTSGAINEMSIGLDAVKFDFSEQEGRQIREIREIRLYDTSDVLWGMNGATAAVKFALPLDTLYQSLLAYKAGARHSTRDTELINKIAGAALELGATNVKLIEEAAETAATQTTPAVTAAQVQFALARARAFAAEIGA